MKSNDVKVLAAVAVIVAGMCLVPDFLDKFIGVTNAHPFVMSFIKFAILATFGECIALRLTSGVYNKPGFGVLPRAIVWGILGIGIGCAFMVYGAGVPVILKAIGFNLAGDAFAIKLLLAFSISFCMNLTFAPFFMTLHKVTDTHIMANDGKVSCLLKPIPMAQILGSLNWNSLWGFVFKKTIPFFWVPAHTITFLLPPHFRVVFAAALGLVLGIILAFANMQKK